VKHSSHLRYPTLPDHYGRRWRKIRRQHLAQNPLCATCLAQGKVIPAAIVDHVTPHHGDVNAYWTGPLQSLCELCHKSTKAEVERNGYHTAIGANGEPLDPNHPWHAPDKRAIRITSATHPQWLERSAILLTIVCGPPCSGKTTHVSEHASAGDSIIDLDVIMHELNPRFRPWSGLDDGPVLRQALLERNRRLTALATATHGAAWFIVSAPTVTERTWWQGKLGGQVLLLNPGPQECKRRALARNTPLAVRGVEDWERRAKRVWLRVLD
jgi:AAA domain-containing protein/HNH endonuclease